jgi:RNA polymerase sigma-70 factor, ECF subfamily
MVAARTVPGVARAPLEELDRAALERCQRGDPVAFRAFVVRYQGAVFALLGRMLGSSGALEDLAQDVFWKAYRAFGSFDLSVSARPSTWLLTIATRVALDELSRSRPRFEPLERAAQLSAGESPERAAARRRLGRAIEAAALELGVEQRAAFVLFTFHDFSVEEIARTLACAPATVKTRLHRARLALRAALAAQHDEELEP